MDTLHPIAATEQLVARGEYNYQVAGKDSGLSERWIIHCIDDQTLIHRAQVGGKIAGMTLRQITHLTLTLQGQPKQLEMRQTIGDDTATRTTQTVIRCFDASVEQSITTDEESDMITLDPPTGYSLFFPPVSAQGFIVGNYDAEAGGRQTLPLVSIRIQPEAGLPLSAEVQHIDYERVSDEAVVETAAGRFNCRHFIRHDQHMEQQLWVDETSTVIRWSVPYSPIMQWEYILTRYYRER